MQSVTVMLNFKQQVRGLGFKIVLICDTCAPTSIPSCSFMGYSYEINRHFIFIMRMLELGLKGCQKFCGLMDMPEFFNQNTYDIIVIYSIVLKKFPISFLKML